MNEAGRFELMRALLRDARECIAFYTLPGDPSRAMRNCIAAGDGDLRRDARVAVAVTLRRLRAQRPDLDAGGFGALASAVLGAEPVPAAGLPAGALEVGGGWMLPAVPRDISRFKPGAPPVAAGEAVRGLDLRAWPRRSLLAADWAGCDLTSCDLRGTGLGPADLRPMGPDAREPTFFDAWFGEEGVLETRYARFADGTGDATVMRCGAGAAAGLPTRLHAFGTPGRDRAGWTGRDDMAADLYEWGAARRMAGSPIDDAGLGDVIDTLAAFTDLDGRAHAVWAHTDIPANLDTLDPAWLAEAERAAVRRPFAPAATDPSLYAPWAHDGGYAR